VRGLAPGVYRYIPGAYRLRLTIGEIVVPALSRAAMGQQAVAQAAAVVVIAAVEERTAQKYGGRAGRYVAFEADAACQNLALQAAAQRLATVVIRAFDDGAVADALQLAPRERPLAVMPVGRPG
jgi:SagB-type dehydrogenase family enzyme